MISTDYRLYDSLMYDPEKGGTPKWRAGDEPDYEDFILVEYNGKITKLPLPDGAQILIGIRKSAAEHAWAERFLGVNAEGQVGDG